jgi:hypothetical protein
VQERCRGWAHILKTFRVNKFITTKHYRAIRSFSAAKTEVQFAVQARHGQASKFFNDLAIDRTGGVTKIQNFSL